MKKLFLILLLLPNFITTEPDQNSDDVYHHDIAKLIEDAYGFHINPSSDTLDTDALILDDYSTRQIIQSPVNVTPTTPPPTFHTIPNTTVPTTPPAPTTNAQPTHAHQKPSYIWTKPLIIDDNNQDFHNLSVIKFTENIVYKPSPQYVYPSIYTYYQAAIIVAKDNVTIDLSGFNLSLDPSAAANFLTNNPTYGIAVYQGVKNLKIISTTPLALKGSISGFSGYGIYAYGITQSYNSWDMYSNYVKNLTIDNLLITQNVNGIYILNGIQPHINNTDIIYNYSPRPLFGMCFVNVLNGDITSCKVNQNFSYSDVCGILLQDTIKMTVNNCTMNANRSIQTGNVTGLLLTATSVLATTSVGNEIENCFAHRNTCAYADNKASIGFHINNGSSHNIIKGCAVSLCGHSPLYPGATIPILNPPTGVGIQIDGAATSNEIANNRSTYNATWGFSDLGGGPLPLGVSSSFWTQNVGILNGTNLTPISLNGTQNYNVNIPTGTILPPLSAPLQVTQLYLNNLTAFTGSGPQLVNLEILKYA